MPDSTTLWKGNLKINTDERGFNFKFFINNATEATARGDAADIGKRYKAIMPPTGQVFYASLHRLGSERDSRYLHEAVGFGTYDPEETPTDLPSDYDFSRTAVGIRLETAEGDFVLRKVCPIPDEIIFGSTIIDQFNPITSPPADPATAPGAAVDWKTELENLVKKLMLKTVHIKTKKGPDGLPVVRSWQRGMLLRVGQKKGGRVFI